MHFCVCLGVVEVSLEGEAPHLARAALETRVKAALGDHLSTRVIRERRRRAGRWLLPARPLFPGSRRRPRRDLRLPHCLSFFLVFFLQSTHGFCSARRESGRRFCRGRSLPLAHAWPDTVHGAGVSKGSRSESCLGECGELDDVSRVRLVNW